MVDQAPAARGDDAAPPLRPLAFLELLDAAFGLYLGRARLLVGASLLVNLPGLALALATVILALLAPSAEAVVAALVLFGLGRLPLTTFCLWFGGQVTFKLAADAHLGEPTSVRGAACHVWDRVYEVLSASLVYAVLWSAGTAAGTLALLLPGLLFFLWGLGSWWLADSAALLEGHGWYDACRRSRALVGTSAHDVARAAGLRSAVWFLMLVVWFTATSLGQYLGVALAGALNAPLLPGALNGLLQLLVLVVLEPFRMTAAAVFWYDLRVRREGFDLELLARRLAKG